MFRYLLRRILLALPTLLVISFLAFGLGRCAPGDPVVNVFGESIYHSLDPAKQAESYRANAVRLGLNGPDFYFTLTTAAYPDTLYRIYPLDRRERLEKLIGQTGNWPAVRMYDQAISKTAGAIEALPASIPQSARLRSEFTFLVRADQLSLIDSATHHMQMLAAEIPDTLALKSNAALILKKAIMLLDSARTVLNTQKLPGKLSTPGIYWQGFENQYHQWLSGFLTGELGLTRRKIKVWDELRPSLLLTVVINGLAIFLAYLIAVPIGVEMARRQGKWPDRWGKRSLFFLYAMPVFWLGGLLIMVFTNTSWGHSLLPDIYFDVQDDWQPDTVSFGTWWSANASKCFLPITILTLHALAVLALQMRSGMLGTLGEDYIRTARAKGVGEEEVYWSHAFRNALFPIITVFASVLPAVFTGSLVVETLFNFPGIGTKTFQAYLGKDLPLLAVIMMVSAALTILGSLIADILYAWVDPRVRFTKKNG
jgi:peptide/nickel transport system permease protein